MALSNEREKFPEIHYIRRLSTSLSGRSQHRTHTFDFIIIFMYTLNNVKYNIVSTDTSKYPCVRIVIYRSLQTTRTNYGPLRSTMTTVENSKCWTRFGRWQCIHEGIYGRSRVITRPPTGSDARHLNKCVTDNDPNKYTTYKWLVKGHRQGHLILSSEYLKAFRKFKALHFIPAVLNCNTISLFKLRQLHWSLANLRHFILHIIHSGHWKNPEYVYTAHRHTHLIDRLKMLWKFMHYVGLLSKLASGPTNLYIDDAITSWLKATRRVLARHGAPGG